MRPQLTRHPSRNARHFSCILFYVRSNFSVPKSRSVSMFHCQVIENLQVSYFLLPLVFLIHPSQIQGFPHYKKIPARIARSDTRLYWTTISLLWGHLHDSQFPHLLFVPTRFGHKAIIARQGSCVDCEGENVPSISEIRSDHRERS